MAKPSSIQVHFFLFNIRFIIQYKVQLSALSRVTKLPITKNLCTHPACPMYNIVSKVLFGDGPTLGCGQVMSSLLRFNRSA